MKSLETRWKGSSLNLAVSSKWRRHNPVTPVILVTPVGTAIGCADWGDGNPEERAVLPLFLWIPPEPSRPAFGGTSGLGENDGVRHRWLGK